MPTSELVIYFTAEKQGAILIAAVGIVATILAVYVWVTGSVFKAMAWPLAIVALGQIAIGAGLVWRTDSQVAHLQEGLRSNPQVTVEAELARMTKVNRSFKIIEIIEVVFLLTGLIMVFVLHSRHITWAAVGMGFILQAAVTLVFDLFAEHRALVYTRWLMDLSHRLSGT